MTLQRLALSIIVSVATLSTHSLANAQIGFPSTRVRVGFHPELNTFEIAGESFYQGRIIAPDGTIFGDVNYRPDDVVGGLTESDLVSRFTGNWTFVATSIFSPGEYEFSITSEQLTTLLPVPEILSPADGAHLPATFNIQHTGIGRAISGTTAGGNGRFASSRGGGLVDESDRLPRDFPLSVTGWAFNYSEFVLGPATQISGTPSQVIVAVTNTSFSAPRNWTVGVPEPTSFAMAAAGVIALAAFRRRI